MKKNIALLFGLVLGLGFVSCSNDDDDEKGTYLAEKSITIYEWKDGKRPSEGKLYNLSVRNHHSLDIDRLLYMMLTVSA